MGPTLVSKKPIQLMESTNLEDSVSSDSSDCVLKKDAFFLDVCDLTNTIYKTGLFNNCVHSAASGPGLLIMHKYFCKPKKQS